MSELKICGITNADFACAAAKRGVDFLGFVFAASSPRRISLEKARTIRSEVERNSAARGLRPRIVGVFVEHTLDEIARICKSLPLDVIQLHGNYSAADAVKLKNTGCEIWALDDFPSSASADAVIIDAHLGEMHGGTGRLADWSRIPKLKLAGRRVVLAGGISAECLADAISTGADIIDVNSSLETSPGLKSVEKLEKLLDRYIPLSGYANGKL